MIEVEIRSFISEKKYAELLDFFMSSSDLIRDVNQETHYFDSEQDLRIQKADDYSKIWLKKGLIHEDAREEIEVKMHKDDFESLGKLFSSLGYGVEIKWFRHRKEFDWKGIKVCLDHTKGYGHIIELEQVSDEENADTVRDFLKKKMDELDVELTPRHVFDERYTYYKENWKTLI